ncbi:MAG: YheU family protein [Alcanivoracaceae bacterium]|nr:YheU family protein [Alcanivoracaceae bacterium]
MIVPAEAIPADTLENLIEEFVTRDGTDYGEQEVPLQTRVEQVRRQLVSGDAVVWFDATTETVSIFSREALANLPAE